MTAAPLLVTRTSAVKPVDHEFAVQPTVQAVAARGRCDGHDQSGAGREGGRGEGDGTLTHVGSRGDGGWERSHTSMTVVTPEPPEKSLGRGPFPYAICRRRPFRHQIHPDSPEKLPGRIGPHATDGYT